MSAGLPTGPTDVDRASGDAGRALARIQSNRRYQGYHLRDMPFGAQRAARRLARFAALATAAIMILLVAAGIVGLVIDGIGFAGVMALLALVPIALALAYAASREKPVRAESISQAALPQLAASTRAYVERQRAALPAPAATIADDIGRKIAALQPQLAALDARAPEAVELRRLVGEELPQLIEGYKRVPETMRRTSRNGRVADTELMEGMQLLDGEIGDLAEIIASSDMDRLSSHKRYLELRYKGDPE